LQGIVKTRAARSGFFLFNVHNPAIGDLVDRFGATYDTKLSICRFGCVASDGGIAILGTLNADAS
jgi:hypothetical protein